MLERSDMIQVSMSYQDSSNVLFLGDKIGDIWNHIVDTMHIWIGKLNSGIYKKNIIFVFDHSRIDSDLIQSSQRNDSDRNFVLLNQLGRILNSYMFHIISVT